VLRARDPAESGADSRSDRAHSGARANTQHRDPSPGCAGCRAFERRGWRSSPCAPAVGRAGRRRAARRSAPVRVAGSHDRSALRADRRSRRSGTPPPPPPSTDADAPSRHAATSDPLASGRRHGSVRQLVTSRRWFSPPPEPSALEELVPDVYVALDPGIVSAGDAGVFGRLFAGVRGPGLRATLRAGTHTEMVQARGRTTGVSPAPGTAAATDRTAGGGPTEAALTAYPSERPPHGSVRNVNRAGGAGRAQAHAAGLRQARRNPDFSAPVATLRQALVGTRTEIETWAGQARNA
jgi:hypothetical protein